jgi:hypothetical protein
LTHARSFFWSYQALRALFQRRLGKKLKSQTLATMVNLVSTSVWPHEHAH